MEGWFAFGLIGIITILCGISFAECDGIFGFILGTFAGFLLGCITYLIVLGAVCLTVPDDSIYTEVLSETPLISLSDSLGVEGQSWLMSGYVNSDLKYYYITETENGYKIQKSSVSDAYIKYIKEGEKPYLQTSGTKSDNWLFKIVNGDAVFDTYYTFYIPEGSIIVENEYKIDLE